MAGQSLSLRLDITPWLAQCDATEDAIRDSVRPTAQAGAQVFYDAIRQNVVARRGKTGNLASSIYQAYSRDNSSAISATYHVSWNATKAPHGHLVEYGYLQRYEITFDPATQRFTTHKDRPLLVPKHVAAKPFVRPAAALIPDAQLAMERAWFDFLAQRGVIK